MSITALLWIALLVFVYIGLYLLNKKTPKPEGCENMKASCTSCSFTACEHNVGSKEEEK